MIILVGNELKMGGLSEVLQDRLNEEIIYIEENMNILNQENDILHLGKNVSYIIYDISQYFNEAEEIINIIKRIYRVNKAKIILYVETDNPKNELVKYAVGSQIKSFINANKTLSQQKDELEKIITGFYEANLREDVVAVEEELRAENKTLNEFVGELFDAKKREEEKESTIIINKKTNSEVALTFFTSFLKGIFAVISITLMSIAILTLLYEDSRLALFKVLENIYKEIIKMF